MLAARIGAKPKFWSLFASDPALAVRAYLGPALPYTYRLVGPHSWDGARDAVMSVWDRTYYATKTRIVPKSLGQDGLTVLKMIVMTVLVLSFFLTIFC